MSKHSKLYKTAEWKRLRAQQLAQHPWCQCPHHKGQEVKATVVDHIERHRGDTRLFYNPRNLQSLAKSCHDAGKQKFEKSGYWPGCNTDGMPVDADHLWNKKE